MKAAEDTSLEMDFKTFLCDYDIFKYHVISLNRFYISKFIQGFLLRTFCMKTNVLCRFLLVNHLLISFCSSLQMDGYRLLVLSPFSKSSPNLLFILSIPFGFIFAAQRFPLPLRLWSAATSYFMWFKLSLLIFFLNFSTWKTVTRNHIYGLCFKCNVMQWGAWKCLTGDADRR